MRVERSPTLIINAFCLLLQQTQNSLRQLLGLGKDRGTSLLQDLVFAQVGGFSSEVCILNTATCGRRVLRNVLQVRDGIIKTILNSTKGSTLRVYLSDSAIYDLNRFLRICSGSDRNIAYKLLPRRCTDCGRSNGWCRTKHSSHSRCIPTDSDSRI